MPSSSCGFGAKPFDTAGGIVAVQRREVDAGQRLEEPGGLGVLLDRAAARQRRDAPLAGGEIDPLVHDPAKIELHARIAWPAVIDQTEGFIDCRLVHEWPSADDNTRWALDDHVQRRNLQSLRAATRTRVPRNQVY